MKGPRRRCIRPGQGCSAVKRDARRPCRSAARRRSRRFSSTISREIGRRRAQLRAGRRLPSAASSVVEQFVLVGGHDAMRRQALDRERPGDADAGFVVIGPVVEQFDIGGLGDASRRSPSGGRCALPTTPRAAPSPLSRPVGVGLARDFPFLPVLAERRVQLGAQRLERRLRTSPRSRRSRHCWRWISA